MSTAYYIRMPNPKKPKIRARIEALLQLDDQRMAVREIGRQIDGLLTEWEEACRFQEEWNLGQSSLGWKFMFRGYREGGPAPYPIVSFSDWKKFLLDTPGIVIFDEYKREHPVLELVKWMEAKPGINREQYYRDTEEGRRFSPRVSDRQWTDAQGFDFTEWDLE